MTNAALPTPARIPTMEEIMEDVRVLEMTEGITGGKDAPEPGTPEFQNALGLIPQEEVRAKGGVADISDPTQLYRLYITKTGEPRDVPYWAMVGKNSILRRKNEDGTRVFTTVQNPVFAAGQVPCLLHPKHPERARYRSYGLINDCQAGSLASYFDQQQHMKLRHRREWATIQENELRDNRVKDDDFREKQANAFATMAETNKLLVGLMTGQQAMPQAPVEPTEPLQAAETPPQGTTAQEGVIDLKKSPAHMNRAELMGLLQQRGIDFDPDATRDVLYALVKG